jgi:ABC-2 type transport system permease protein
MFAHIFIYRLKCLLRDKETIFWTLLFPLLFGLLLSHVLGLYPSTSLSPSHPSILIRI